MSSIHPSTVSPNRTLFQAFEWHTPSSPPASHETHSPYSHYARLIRLLPVLASIGINAVWLPPGCKSNWLQGNGYDCYDLWDLGEFDQKNTRSTKWGSREELDEVIATAKVHRVDLIWDAVLNHKIAGDATEECWAVEVDADDRRYEICAPRKIEAWLKFDFPGRGERYSSFKWRAEHFNGTDWDQRGEKHAIFKLIDDPATLPKPGQTTSTRTWTSFPRRLKQSLSTAPPSRPGKGWAQDVDDMHGNSDYLLFSNIYHTHSAVQQDVSAWGQWMVQSVGIDGFRLDAAQHFSSRFTKDWIRHVHQAYGRHCFVVGEIWTAEVHRIIKWLDAVGNHACAFDSPLLMAFSRLSQAIEAGGVRLDLRKLTATSLLEKRPDAAVTVVTNHDTQRGQASYTPMNGQLKTLFYAFVLLREAGLPCVFMGDLYGTHGPEAERPACLSRDGTRSFLPDLVLARHLFAYGKQTDYFDDAHCIAWTRTGTHAQSGCVVMISVRPTTQISRKKIATGSSAEVWIDILSDSTSQTSVMTDKQGSGVFTCYGCSAAVYIRRSDELAHRFPVRFDLAAGT